MFNGSRENPKWLGKFTWKCQIPLIAGKLTSRLSQEPPATIAQPTEEGKRMGITGPRFCKTCNVFKPPRSHHCSACRRCVLKMDHHCPWIANCVGYDNYGHFLRFLIYVDLATLYVLILLIWRIRKIMDDIRHFRVSRYKIWQNQVLWSLTLEDNLSFYFLLVPGRALHHWSCLPRPHLCARPCSFVVCRRTELLSYLLRVQEPIHHRELGA